MTLGFIVSPLGQEVPGQYPNEIAFAFGGNGTFEEPFDPQFNERGEAGLYYDTPLGGLGRPGLLAKLKRKLGLGAIPTDAELATVYGRTPVVTGWVNAQEGFFPAPWRPPGGWNPAGAFGPQPSLSGLGFTLPDLSGLAWVGLAAGAGAILWHLWKK